MGKILSNFISVFMISFYLISCHGNENTLIKDMVIDPDIISSQADENRNDSTTPLKTDNQNDIPIIKAVDPLSVVEGTYYLRKTNDIDGNPSKKIVVRILRNKIISLNNNETYDFKEIKERDKTILKFGTVSEESGDWYGGGRVEVSKGKSTLIILTGSEANFESVYNKKSIALNN